MIDRFSGEYRFLSNFYEHPVYYDGRLYPTNEHAFAAAKTTDVIVQSQIAAAGTASQAKALGRRAKLVPGWDQYRRYVAMEHLIAMKFMPESELTPLLLNTGEEALVEGNTWHDQVWGDCRCGDVRCKSVGMNLLGWMLMRQRTWLREETSR